MALQAIEDNEMLLVVLQDDQGGPAWGSVDPDLLYGSQGWCEAKHPKKK